MEDRDHAKRAASGRIYGALTAVMGEVESACDDAAEEIWDAASAAAMRGLIRGKIDLDVSCEAGDYRMRAVVCDEDIDVYCTFTNSLREAFIIFVEEDEEAATDAAAWLRRLADDIDPS